MIHFLRGTLARLSLLGAIALIVLAVLVTVVRLALPAADQYRGQVIDALSDRLGLPVRMGSLSIRLSGWTPRLSLKDVVLADPEGGADLLSLAALDLDLDLPASLRLGSPQIRAATLVGARLVLHRFADGRIRVQGLGSIQSDNPRTLELFLRQGQLSLVDSEVALVDDRIGGALPRLTDVQLRMTNDGQTHRLDLRAHAEQDDSAPGASSGDVRLHVLAVLRGDGLDIETWGGKLYLGLNGADALAMAPADLPGAGRVRAEGLTVESWLRLSRGHLEEGLVRLDLDGLRLPAPFLERRPIAKSAEPRHEPGSGAIPPTVQEVEIDRLSALGRIAATTDGWQVGVRDLGFGILGAEAAGLDLDLGLSSQGRLEALTLAADRLDLALLGPLRRLYPAPLPRVARSLVDLEPRGRLERIAFELDPRGSEHPRWRLAAVGDRLGVEHVGRIPGFCGLGLRLRADQDGGEVHLGSDWLRLDLAPVFDRPLYLDRFAGRLSWALGPDGSLRLSGRELVLENPDLRGRARFSLDLPVAGADPSRSGDPGPFLDLRASLHDGVGARARTYLPVGIMHPKLVQWLERALVGGRVPQADLILRGPLRRFPFREHQGRFELLVEIEDGGLDYREGWPPIEEARGDLQFVNQGMEVRIDSARMLDSVLTAGLASIPDLRGVRRLSVHGEAEGPLADGLRILGETPLAERLGAVARTLEVAGDSNLTLDLEVPLKKGEPLDLAGHLTWPGPARLTVKGTPITLTDLAGDLSFTKDTLIGQSSKARLWGRPLELSVTTRKGGEPSDAVTQIRARSRMPVSELARHLPSRAWSLAMGESVWDLALDLGHADLRRAGSPIRWRLGSDLRGLALGLPPPLGKPAAQALPLSLEGGLLPGRSLDLRGGTADLGLDLALDLSGGPPRLQGGRVVLGTKRPPPTEPVAGAGLAVAGSLESLDLPAWGEWWWRFREEVQGGRVSGSDSSPIPGLRDLDLRIARLGLGTGALTDARLRASRGESPFTLKVRSRELDGDLTLPGPGSGSPWQFIVARVDLAALLPPASARGTAPPVEAQAGAKAQARDRAALLPALDLRVEDLRWAEEGLGRLSLDLRPEPFGLDVRQIDLQGPGDTQAQGEASWVDGPEGGHSRLTLDLSCGDTGLLMRALDYRSVLSEAPLQSHVQLEWPSGLGSFALARSTGTIELEVGAGRLLEVEPGVGRVLGILNLGALSRRLALDFTDLYEKGFSFEQIHGEIRVGGGRAELRRFEIEGPASAIRVSGFTDLRTRTFDQTVTVEPRIGSSVALAGALAGGPVVGAAVYLADKMSGGAIDKLGAYRYRVTGPWAEPQLTRLGWDPFASQAEPGPPSGQSDPSGPESQSPPSRRPEQNHFLD